jgi:hypothetical protein
VIGETERTEGNRKEIRLEPATNKEKRDELLGALYTRKDVTGLISEADYIVKLDDDDIISPTLLGKASAHDFDLYYDKYHTFYDISSGIISQQKRPWVASTCIQKTEHAFAKRNPQADFNYYANSVLYQDHSKGWHIYYADKKKMIATPEHPVYLRILSPTSITSGAKKFPLDSIHDVDFDLYYRYLRKFGMWHSLSLADFDQFLPSLGAAWENFSGGKQHPIPKKYLETTIGERLAGYGKAFRKLF